MKNKEDVSSSDYNVFSSDFRRLEYANETYDCIDMFNLSMQVLKLLVPNHVQITHIQIYKNQVIH